MRSVRKSLFSRRLSSLRACNEKGEFLAKFQEIESQAARAEGVRLLARKGYFGPELKQKLMLKGISEEAAGEAVQYFEQKGYIHDGNRAVGVARRELKKGHGPQYIFQMLKHKKISSSEVAKLRPVIEKEEKQSLQAYLKKRSSALQGKDRRKIIAQLLRRGFSYEAVQEAFKGSMSEIDIE
ncbi:MAG: RecX family transcriptional regulator [Verrucomicrobia bacterium]|nr:RecX family transcriptional regulator [Verrucomicrobiota bacterium]